MLCVLYFFTNKNTSLKNFPLEMIKADDTLAYKKNWMNSGYDVLL